MQLAATYSALYRLDGQIGHLPTSNPMIRQHTRRGKRREEQDGRHLTYRNERRVSEAVKRRRPRHQVVEVAGSRCSGRWSPAAAPYGRRQQKLGEATSGLCFTPPRRQSCTAMSFFRPARRRPRMSAVDPS
jgi:hypothetical protein